MRWFATLGFKLMPLFLKVLHLCFQLVYQTFFLLDECSGLINMSHQFHYKLNVVLIFKLYLFRHFSHFFNGMSTFTHVSLTTIFYVSFPIFCWTPIIFVLYLSTLFFLSLWISLRWSMVFFAISLIILISSLIKAYFL